MRVYVKLSASLQKLLPCDTRGNRVACTLPEGATVADLIGQLGLSLADAGIVVADDAHVETDARLREGQEILIFPPLAGGAACATEKVAMLAGGGNARAGG
jgi:molybdopterin converting factor small subunit